MPATEQTQAGSHHGHVGSATLPMPGDREQLPWDSSTAGDALAAPNELSLMSSAAAVVMGMELMQCLSVTIHFSANRGTSVPFAL